MALATSPILQPEVDVASPVIPGRRLHHLDGPLGVALAAVVVGVAAGWFASANDLVFLYADARSHLTISRRLIDGPNDGIVQLGTVWLPLPHVLMIPFVASRWMWHNGLAALPVGIVCLVVEALSVFSIVTRLSRSKIAAWSAVAFLLTNPSVLYLHTTALTEPPLFAAMALTVAGLVRWATAEKAFSGGEVALFCGAPAGAAVLARYDGWAFVAAASAAVLVVAWHRWKDFRYAVKMVRCFVIIPVIAAAWWMWFNWFNFGDPLEFQRGQYSAQAQQDLLDAQGRLPDKGKLIHSLDTYTTSIVRGAGTVIVVVAIAGMVVWTVRQWRHRNESANIIPWLLVAVPFAFYVVSLVSGQIVVRLETTATEGMFNLRYGIAVIAGLVVFAALAIGVLDEAVQRRWIPITLAVLVATAALWNTALADGWRQVGVIAEGVDQRAAGADQYAAGEWLHDHARSGIILIDDSVNPLLPVIDADLDRVVAPFSENWDETLENPARADWVFIDTGNPFDAVGIATSKETTFATDFELVFHLDKAEVYRKRGGGS